ncbi:hypothetical protein PG994_006234 [Apiospora phragmitis]|uniref:Uncharacterized protein n=1 Tax=Apiospora phragmitis TaxID=2905665 RepID=A0ABR1VI95_9PEZI
MGNDGRFMTEVIMQCPAETADAAENITSGGGEMVASVDAHLLVSLSTCADSLWEDSDEDLGGARREMVWTAFTLPRLKRVVRIWEPTWPVQPTTAAVAMALVPCFLLYDE